MLFPRHLLARGEAECMILSRAVPTSAISRLSSTMAWSPGVDRCGSGCEIVTIVDGESPGPSGSARYGTEARRVVITARRPERADPHPDGRKGTPSCSQPVPLRELDLGAKSPR